MSTENGNGGGEETTTTGKRKRNRIMLDDRSKSTDSARNRREFVLTAFTSPIDLDRFINSINIIIAVVALTERGGVTTRITEP